jgi:spore germination protein GerM
LAPASVSIGSAGRLVATAWAAVLTLAAAGSCAAPPDAPAAATMPVRVYFNNERLAAVPADCAVVFERRREVPKSSGVATAALRQLFAGPGESERAAGYRSPFSASTAGLLKRVFVEHGTAYVDLNDPRALLPGATSSCGAAEFNAQIERTLRQFPTVRRVILAIDGDPHSYYAWMGQDCDLTNDRCDPAPFAAARR